MPSYREIIFWFVFALMGTVAARLLYLALIGRRNDGRPRCPKCGYDMTGAPSLTCPECGTNAGTARRLTARRRSFRRLIDAAGLALLLWYSLHVRYRIRELNETPHTAMKPTTYFILRSAMSDAPADVQDTVCERFFHHNAAEPRVQQWQVWLESWAVYENLKAKPASGLRDSRMELLHRLSFHCDAAKERWTELVLISDPQLANAMLTDLMTPRSEHLRSPALRLALWERYQHDLNSIQDPAVVGWILQVHPVNDAPSQKRSRQDSNLRPVD